MKNKLVEITIQNDIKKQGSIILAFFLMVQPILDLNVFFLSDFLTVAGITFPTIVRYLFTLAFTLYFVFQIIRRNIEVEISTTGRNIVLIILMIVLSYVICHLIVITGKSYIYQLFSASIFGEISYLIRISVPLVLLIYFFYFEVYKHLSKLMISWLILIPLSIVVTNVTGIALSSYTNNQIEYTFFDWFNKNLELSYRNTGSKGFFRYANQVSMVISMILPYFSIQLFKKQSWYNFLSVSIVFISMTMIGTKVGLYSFPLLFLTSYLCFVLYEVIVAKNKPSLLRFVIVVFFLSSFLLIAPYTPSSLRSTSTNIIIDSAIETENEVIIETENEVIIETENEVIIETENEVIIDEQPDLGEDHVHNMTPIIPSELGMPLEELYQKIDELYSRKRIDTDFITLTYPYTEDPDFWFTLLQQPSSKLIDNRFVEQSILQRVKFLNDNPLDDYLGIGYTRMHNLFPLEKDFISQFYTLGVVGLVLFFGVYLIPFGLLIIIIGKRKLFSVKMEMIVSLMPLIFLLPLALTSGNILDSLLPTILLAFLISHSISLFKQENI